MSDQRPTARSGGRGGHELDPAESPARWERSVASVLRAAAPELRRRAEGPGVAGQIGRWARPLVAAAAAVIAAASAMLVGSVDGGGPAADRTAGGAGAAGPAAGGDAPGASAALPRRAETTADLETALYPGPVGTWMQGDEQPTVEEIVFSASVGHDRR